MNDKPKENRTLTGFLMNENAVKRGGVYEAVHTSAPRPDTKANREASADAVKILKQIAEAKMTNNPTCSSGTQANNVSFKPGDVAWHVRHGKVTLEAVAGFSNRVRLETPHALACVLLDGREGPNDVGRVLYTLEEARQYGWYKPEPRVVEFEFGPIQAYDVVEAGVIIKAELFDFVGKRVHVTVREVTND